jgi:hypothetical protein
LHADECGVAVRDEIEGSVFAERGEHDEALVRKVRNRVSDADVTLVLRVVWSHPTTVRIFGRQWQIQFLSLPP